MKPSSDKISKYLDGVGNKGVSTEYVNSCIPSDEELVERSEEIMQRYGISRERMERIRKKAEHRRTLIRLGLYHNCGKSLLWFGL